MQIYCTSTNGIKTKGIHPVNINDYPTLKQYFDSFGKSFQDRGEKGDTVYNLRNCAYIDKYQYPKILYADIVQNEGRFYLDEEGYFTNDTAFMISGGNHLYYLLGILNSIAFTFFYKNFFCGSKLGKKGLRYKRDFLLKVPIPKPRNGEERIIIKNVQTIQKKKKNNPQADTSAEEREIDNIVFDLYGLTEEERNEIIKES